MSEPTVLYNTLKEIFFFLDDGDRRFFKVYNLSVPRYFALKHIVEHPGISPTQLSEKMITDKSNITRLTRGMEAEGLIEKHPHETDGRTLRLFPTQYGKALYERASNGHRDFNETRLAFLAGDEELAQELIHIKEALQAQLGYETDEGR